VTADYFASKGVDSPRLAAERLLAHAMGCERIDLYTRFQETLPAETVGRYRELVRRRATREPIQHVLGATEFWSLKIKCDRRALVPRPETEGVVQAVLDLLREIADPAAADIGTGTGCIAVALAKELKAANVVASDISSESLALAGENLAAHGLGDRVRLIEGDLVAPFREVGLIECFDAVVSNPPYVTDEEMTRLMPEVRDFDPPLALRGGLDGLDVIRRLAAETPVLLKPGGRLIVEIGQGQLESSGAILRESGWTIERTLPDAAGIPRVVAACRV